MWAMMQKLRMTAGSVRPGSGAVGMAGTGDSQTLCDMGGERAQSPREASPTRNRDHLSRGPCGTYDPGMTRLRRGATVAALALAGLVAGTVAGTAPSYAAGSFQDFVDQAIDHNGEPPTCTKVNG